MCNKVTVTGLTRREACGSICKLLLLDMVKNTGRVEQMANSHIDGKAEEYSSKRAWSTIGEQYPEGKAERNPGNKQKVRNQTARQHKKIRLNTKTKHGKAW